MSELKRRLRDVAGSDGPPSRLSADEVYAEAFRRRHRRATAWAAGGVVGVVLVGAMGVTTLATPDPVTAPHPAQSADGWPAETRDGTIISAAATDATHLYAGVASCPGQDQVRHCTTRLVGSDDAGRTWTVRQTEFGDGQVTAPAPGVLLRTIESVRSPVAKISYQHRISTDGGRTWRELRLSGEPLAEVPSGGWLQCAQPTAHPTAQTCSLLAVDPTTAVAARLASQPALTIEAPAHVPTSAGLWVTGHDPTDRSRPAVAVSHDRGRTWETHVFGREELLSTYLDAVPFSVDGDTAYTVISGSKPSVFRSTDGGRNWQPDPGSPPRVADSFVAADGTHIVLGSADPPWLWYAGDASGYHPVELKGLSDRLPPAPALVRVTAPGVYVAFDRDAVYRSADGLNWTRTLVRVPPS
ncbi:BNR/Asp-box repeat protein [Asanoa ferruginea]|uniref:BNR/Asp-box repeat protein n=1 Tax=Asanoa ferruginea TaxID=53367 RepID=A0A3D9ZJG8_9ACTN|nr:hypothetical protein [Asanoa ferruginea]REF97425.1 BNR/Asp-box repeat protein [Asanoa ferruginea]GIF48291.1 hypothetical protein Afe04nite_28300 [Asanoa ferruginea]